MLAKCSFHSRGRRGRQDHLLGFRHLGYKNQKCWSRKLVMTKYMAHAALLMTFLWPANLGLEQVWDRPMRNWKRWLGRDTAWRNCSSCASCPRTNEFNVMCPSFPSKWPNSVPSQTLQRAVPKVIIFHNCSTTKHELHAHKSVVLLSNRTIANKPKILLNVTDHKFYGQSSLTRCFPVTLIFRDAWNNQLKNKKRFLGYQRENWTKCH